MSQSRIIIVFGKMGSGKTTAGQMLANQLGFDFCEGDNSVPDAMREKVKKFGDLDKSDIDCLVANLVANIENSMAQDKNIVVSQALYLNEHRKILQEKFSKYNIEFVCINTPVEKQMAQLAARENGEQWKKYAEKNDVHFQAPDACLNAHMAQNVGDINQLATDLLKLPISAPTAKTISAIAIAGIFGSHSISTSNKSTHGFFKATATVGVKSQKKPEKTTRACCPC